MHLQRDDQRERWHTRRQNLRDRRQILQPQSLEPGRLQLYALGHRAVRRQLTRARPAGLELPEELQLHALAVALRQQLLEEVLGAGAGVDALQPGQELEGRLGAPQPVRIQRERLQRALRRREVPRRKRCSEGLAERGLGDLLHGDALRVSLVRRIRRRSANTAKKIRRILGGQDVAVALSALHSCRFVGVGRRRPLRPTRALPGRLPGGELQLQAAQLHEGLHAAGWHAPKRVLLFRLAPLTCGNALQHRRCIRQQRHRGLYLGHVPGHLLPFLGVLDIIACTLEPRVQVLRQRLAIAYGLHGIDAPGAAHGWHSAEERASASARLAPGQVGGAPLRLPRQVEEAAAHRHAARLPGVELGREILCRQHNVSMNALAGHSMREEGIARDLAREDHRAQLVCELLEMVEGEHADANWIAGDVQSLLLQQGGHVLHVVDVGGDTPAEERGAVQPVAEMCLGGEGHLQVRHPILRRNQGDSQAPNHCTDLLTAHHALGPDLPGVLLTRRGFPGGRLHRVQGVAQGRVGKARLTLLLVSFCQ
mmetsp:Transcript_74342/g.209578  ORF Transcript_74342/g.209578 Transcript_74342/m.209578 type:complete len:538 (+) Transcript_74342:1218-2831(+)